MSKRHDTELDGWDISGIKNVKKMFDDKSELQPINLVLGKNDVLKVELQPRSNGTKVLHINLNGGTILRADVENISIKLCELTLTS